MVSKRLCRPHRHNIMISDQCPEWQSEEIHVVMVKASPDGPHGEHSVLCALAGLPVASAERLDAEQLRRLPRLTSTSLIKIWGVRF